MEVLVTALGRKLSVCFGVADGKKRTRLGAPVGEQPIGSSHKRYRTYVPRDSVRIPNFDSPPPCEAKKPHLRREQLIGSKP
jgi:hypothetical protein